MPFLLCPRMLRQPTVKFYAQNMAIPHNDCDLVNSHFYAVQCGKLKALLDTVVEESKTVRDPEACIDYLELTGILTDMLNEAHYYSALSSDELSVRDAHIQFFLAKVDTVKGTIADWDQRSRRMRMVSRKRARRSVDLHAETMAAMKRRRDEDEDRSAVPNADHRAPFPQTWSMDLDAPSVSQPWWSQQQTVCG